MNRAELFKKTVDVLYKAYKENHLKHMSSCGCAVGNLIYHGLHNDEFHSHVNGEPFYTEGRNWFDLLLAKYGKDSFLSQQHLSHYQISNGYLGLRATGYTDEEIRRIEAAFEGVDPEISMDHIEREKHSDRCVSDPTGFNGLMDVLDVLGEIHEAPAVADCLKKSIANGNYGFETEEFKEKYKHDS